MVDDCRGGVRNSVSAGEDRCEGVALIADLEGCASTEAFIEEVRGKAGTLAEGHVGSEADSAKGRHFEPVRILVGKDARSLKGTIYRERVGCDDLAGGGSVTGIAEWFNQESEPVGCRSDV